MVASPPAKTTYHHGDLHAALLQAARELLERNGISALTLRGITRYAGVSPTAAAPHFGNLQGLLTALAVQGFEELAAKTNSAASGNARERRLAYVQFAVANPALFTLMFRGDALDNNDTALRNAASKAFARLKEADVVVSASTPLEQAATISRLWAKVHGLAVLAIDGHLEALRTNFAPDADMDALVMRALE